MPLEFDADDDGTLRSINAVGELTWQEQLVLSAARHQIVELNIDGEWSDDGLEFTATA